MSRQPPPGGPEANTLKGVAIIVGAVVLGMLVTASFPDAGTGLAVGSPTGTSSTVKTARTTSTLQAPPSPTTTTPARSPKDVKVLVANGTATTGATKKVIDALKPACYAGLASIDATAKVKAEKRPTTTVYATTGYEREAALITTQLGLQTTSNAALPPESPIPTKGVPSFNVLVLVGQDLVDTPPQALPVCADATTTTTKKGTTVTTRSTATTVRATTTTKAQPTTTKRPSTTVTTA